MRAVEGKVVVQINTTENTDMTSGGLYVPENLNVQTTVEARVVGAWDYSDLDEGDSVLIPFQCGFEYKHNGTTYRTIDESSILAILNDF